MPESERPEAALQPAVAHRMPTYLGRTETFIHDYLSAFRRVRPVIIARKIENRDLFPVPQGACLRISPPRRGSASWAATAVGKRLRGGDPHLQKILRRERVRLIHAHFGPTACELLDVRRITGLPLVTSFYGYDASISDVVEEFGQAYRRLFDVGDAFLVEGSQMKKRLESIGCPASKLKIQRIGIDPSSYEFRERTESSSGNLTLLQCGRLVPKKGYGVTLPAFARAAARNTSLRLRVLGDGPERQSLVNLAGELGIRDYVEFLGAQPRSVFLEELNKADIYMQPSVTAPDGDSEGGAPTTLLEAQAAGLPILTSRHADIPEVVRPDVSALLSDEGNIEALAENIGRLAAEPQRWASMGRAGRAHVEEFHDIGNLATELEIVYAQLAEAGRLAS